MRRRCGRLPLSAFSKPAAQRRRQIVLESFFTVGKSVLQLFLMAAVGFLAGKTKLMDDRSAVGMTNLLLYICTPFMMVVAFQSAPADGGMQGFCIAAALTAVLHAIMIPVAHLVIRRKDPRQAAVFRLSSILSNSSFMALPLQMALLGGIGVFYGSAYSVVFNLIAWTYGLWMITGGSAKPSPKLLLNPGLLGIVAALALFLSGIRVPELLLTPLTHVGNLTIPLPMIVIGYQLSRADLRAVLRKSGLWLSMLLRLLVFPAVSLALMLALHIDRTILLAVMIAAAAPSATIVNMFAVHYGGDAELSSATVTTHTLFSALTMSLMVGMAMALTQ